MKTTFDVTAGSSVKFGTSGARGLVSQMTDDVCFAYARAFLSAIGLKPGGRVALGIDLRPSSPRIASACAEAIHHAGGRVDYCGPLPTPALAFYAQQEGVPAIMVTGSHIPFDRNGIKFYRPNGEIAKADEAAILAARIEMPGGTLAGPLPRINPEAGRMYVARYLDFFPGWPLSGMRLGFYEHSSVARDLFREILEGLGAEVVSLGRTDEFVPIDTEAVGEEDIRRARRWADAYRLDAIFSTDGDADRPLLGDERGDWLRGDVVGILCARYLGATAVATPVSSNTAMEGCGAFARIARTRIGSPYVIEAMEALAESGAGRVVGYEANGGFLVGTPIERKGRVLEPLPTRDSALPILTLLVAAREWGLKVSQLTDDLPQRYTASDRLQDFPAERSRRLLAGLAGSPTERIRLLGELCGTPIGQDLTDGLRMTFENGEIVHLRPSGNAPELRCYAEADSRGRAEELVRLCLDRIRADISQE